MTTEVVNRSFSDVKYREALVSGLWTGCPSHDFEQMSVDYHQAGLLVLSRVLSSRNLNFTCDSVFPAGVYMLRHAVELALKDVVCASSSNQQICECFQKDKHDVEALFKRCKPTLTSFLDSSSIEWFADFVHSAERLDSRANLFRYPLSLKAGRAFGDEFIDIIETSKTLVSAYEIISLVFRGSKYTAPIHGISAKYLSTAGCGIGNCMLCRSTTSAKHYSAAEGFSAAAKILYEGSSMSWRKKCFPLLFLLRHAIELELKHLTCARNTIGAKSDYGHRFKKLWSIPEGILRQRATDSNWDLSPLNIVNNQLLELGKLDKDGFLFRYPVSKSLEYKLPSDSILDVKSIYEYQMGIIRFLAGCNAVIDEMADYENGMF